MTPARWRQVQDLLNDALAVPPADRPQFVAVACSGDPELRREVDSLLQRASATSDLLNTTIMETAAPFLRPQTTLVGRKLGPYSVRSRLGGGGMGDVFLAEDTRLHRLVALKALHEDGAATPQRRERLLREARAVAALNHPNIAVIYDVFENADDGDAPPYIVMEYVDGETLSDRLSAGPLPVDDVLRIGKAIATALAVAHKRGIVHRDLKPANLHLTTDGGVKVLDFGLARMLHAAPDAPTESPDGVVPAHGRHGVAGTPGYMSLEQALGHSATPASDIFSFGVVLFQMLTGRRPFGGDDFLSAALAMIASPVPRVGNVVHGVPPHVDALISRMLSKERADRPSADEIAQGLEGTPRMDAVVVADMVTAKAPRRRIRGPLIGVSALALVGATVLVGSESARRQLGFGYAGVPTPVTLAIMPIGAAPVENAAAEYLGAAIASVVAGNFGAIPHVTVLSRGATAPFDNDVDSFAALRRSLGATHVLRLSWASIDPTLRLEARLYRPGVPSPIWDQIFEGDASAIEQDLLIGLGRELERARSVGFSRDERNRVSKVPTASGAALFAYAEGTALLNRQAHDVDRALLLLQQATAIDPQFVFAWVELGSAWWNKYRDDKSKAAVANAKEALGHAVALDPDSAPVHFALGDMQYRTGEPALAEASFRRALQLQPDYDAAQRNLAQVLSDSGRVDEAEALLQQAIRVSRSWNNFYVLGTIEYRAGRYAQAIDAFTNATDVAPKDPAAFTMLGNVSYIQGNLQQAVDHFEHAVGLGATAAAYANLALVYYSQERYQDALRSYAQALRQNPRSIVNHRNIGDVYRRLGRTRDAAAEYERAVALGNEALQINPRDARTIALIALCEAKLAHRVDALRHAAEAVAIDSSSREAWQRSAEVHALLNDPDAALRDLSIAVARGFEPRMARADDELSALRSIPRFEEILNTAQGHAFQPRGATP
jgi:tetratricopeptide (TPR) repeat protein